MDTLKLTFAFPDLAGPQAGDRARSLLRELEQDADLHPHLDREETSVKRTDREAQDFGITLVAVLGAPAVVVLAKAIRSWAERTGTSSIEMNGVRIENLRSQDAAKAIEALAKSAGQTHQPGRK